MGENISEKLAWAPQPGPQTAFTHCPYPLVGFGGSRGGGKSDGVLGKWGIKAIRQRKHFNAVFFRKELPQADDLIERAKEIYIPLGSAWQEQKKLFTFPGGGRVRFRPLENAAAAEKYQGQNLSDACVEEAGNYPDPAPIWMLFGALRGDNTAQLILTFNPGGTGHSWIKKMFWDPAPLGMKRLEIKLPTGNVVPYIFIPSRVTDNRELLRKDPGYIDRLHLVGSPELVRAWLEGDFEIHEGTYFPEFSSRHIVRPFPIPKHWPKYVGFDWGFHSPYCVVWGAVSSGKDDAGNEVPYPKGSIIIYRELTGKGVQNADLAQQIVNASGDEDPTMVADTQIFSEDGGQTIADQFHEVFARHNFPRFRPADKDRLSGAAQIRARLAPNPAMIYFFETCPYLIETIPSLVIDIRKPEDVDTTGNDHGYDALRYLCKERLLESFLAEKVEPVKGGVIKLQAYVDQVRRDRNRARI